MSNETKIAIAAIVLAKPMDMFWTYIFKNRKFIGRTLKPVWHIILCYISPISHFIYCYTSLPRGTIYNILISIDIIMIVLTMLADLVMATKTSINNA